MQFSRLPGWQTLLLLSALNLHSQPTIKEQPIDQNVSHFETIHLSVQASGIAPLSYQWFKSETAIPAGTNAALSIPQSRFSDAGIYSVQITDMTGTITSTNAIVTVKAASAGSVDFSFSSKTNIEGTGYSIALQEDGKILFGGRFFAWTSPDYNNLIRFNPDGSVDTNFVSSIPLNGTGMILTLAIQPDHKILVGGNRVGVPGSSVRMLFRLNENGSFDTAFTNQITSGSLVSSIALQEDGKIVLGGYFNAIGKIPRGMIARLNPDSTLDTNFLNGLSGANDTVECVAIQSDGKILAAGGFTNFNGMPKNLLVRLETDGSVDTNFNAQFQAVGNSATISCMALQADGKILVGGNFTAVNGVTNSQIVRLESNGSTDPTFRAEVIPASPTTSQFVRAITVQPDGKILIGGDFQGVSGLLTHAIARLNPDGSLDRTFSKEHSGAIFPVNTFALDSTGKILVGGSFTLLNTIKTGPLARLWARTESIPLFLEKAGSTIELSWPPSDDQYHIEKAADLSSPVHWTPLPISASTNNGCLSLTLTNTDAQSFYRLANP